MLNIGTWVRRPKARAKWHLVESIIDSDPVTKCGRRLREDKERPLEGTERQVLTRAIGQPQNCKACGG